jgi:hypothetical protein
MCPSIRFDRHIINKEEGIPFPFPQMEQADRIVCDFLRNPLEEEPCPRCGAMWGFQGKLSPAPPKWKRDMSLTVTLLVYAKYDQSEIEDEE